jgi:asparagine synthase (glutamine-hydrolysing)
MNMVSHWAPSERVVRNASTASSQDEQDWLALPDFALQAMYLDASTYLPNDILSKLDRATMAFGLEGRIPYLDHRLVEFSWRLPLRMKVRPDCGKWILRQLLRRYVPSQLVERSKMGFGIPLDSWLRTSLRDWAEALLDPNRLRQEGFFDSAVIRRTWEAHLQGRGIWQHHLWDILMFQSWLENQANQQPQVSSFASA